MHARARANSGAPEHTPMGALRVRARANYGALWHAPMGALKGACACEFACTRACAHCAEMRSEDCELINVDDIWEEFPSISGMRHELNTEKQR